MNERIKELAEQAGIVNRKFSFGQWWETELTPEQKKFAELIVQGCITLADNEAERFSNLDQEYCAMAMDNYRELVRKHFGVEE